jgi:hypothetical protein
MRYNHDPEIGKSRNFLEFLEFHYIIYEEDAFTLTIQIALEFKEIEQIWKI